MTQLKTTTITSTPSQWNLQGGAKTSHVLLSVVVLNDTDELYILTQQYRICTSHSIDKIKRTVHRLNDVKCIGYISTSSSSVSMATLLLVTAATVDSKNTSATSFYCRN